MNTAYRWLFILILGLSITSCQKELSDQNPNPVNPPSTNISATISGRVTDVTGQPIKGAIVTAGTRTATTDLNGVFRLNNANLVDKRAFVKVEKTGYFTGSRTFFARQGQNHYVEIELLTKTNVGNINATTGGSITLTDGSVITLPANGVVVQNGGAAYTGIVEVAMTWLDPTADNLNRMMPGDLRGVDEAGNERGLVSYGMMSVELTGSTGEKLQIATGKKASLKFPLPAAIQGNAPATIALWSFNETTGLWKQEGMANKVGTAYEAEVSHFSFWNCDAPYLNVQFSATFKDQNGNPLVHKLVKITRNSGSGWTSSAHGYTDTAGYVSGIVPQNEVMSLSIYVNYSCNTAIHTQNIGPFATNSQASLGVVTVNVPSQNNFTVTGTAENCTGGPVTDGYAEIKFGYQVIRSAINNGSFNLNFQSCGATQQVSYIIVDNTTSQQSSAVTTTLNAGNTALGNIVACGTSTQQFINYTFDGISYSLAAPPDSLNGYTYSQGTTFNYTIINGSSNSSNTGISFTYNGQGIGSFPLESIFVWSPTIDDSLFVSTPIDVVITEFGNAGGYIAGSFNGTVQGVFAPTHTIQCNFRVRRQF